MLDYELNSWPIEADDRRRIRERRLSMFGRSDWSDYPAGVRPRAGNGSMLLLAVGIPVACIATIVGLVLSGNPMTAFAFGCTFVAEAAILAVVYRSRRRLLHRAAAAELGYPVCISCGFYNLGHERGEVCNECGLAMPVLPEEVFPPPEPEERVQRLRDIRRRIPTPRFDPTGS